MARSSFTFVRERRSFRYVTVLLTLTISLLSATPSVATPSPLPPFTVSVSIVTATALGKTWHPGCPVAPTQLRLVHVRYVGFNGHADEGSIVVSASVARAVIR
ncbi:MAG: hypothetical protein ABI298_00700, partial [Acidimicrobiales bacterium]